VRILAKCNGEDSKKKGKNLTLWGGIAKGRSTKNNGGGEVGKPSLT